MKVGPEFPTAGLEPEPNAKMYRELVSILEARVQWREACIREDKILEWTETERDILLSKTHKLLPSRSQSQDEIIVRVEGLSQEFSGGIASR